MTKKLAAVLAVAAAATVAPDAAARSVVLTHGRFDGTPSSSDLTAYWKANDAALAGNDGFSGKHQTAYARYNNYYFAYNGSNAWDSNGAGSPVCTFDTSFWSYPDTDNVLVGHSAGGLVNARLAAAAANGISIGCTHTAAELMQYVTYIVTDASPWRGSELANAVYGQTGGNWLSSACGTVAGTLANMISNQRTAMTDHLRTSYMNNTGFASLNGSRTFPIYLAGGWGRDGDDATKLGWAASCAAMPSWNDGVVSCASAFGNTGNTCDGSVGVPYGNFVHYNGVSHSSNRHDYKRSGETVGFATAVYNGAPY